jgi:hydrogenase-4 component E
MIDVLIGFFIATLISAIFTTRLFRLYNWYALNSLFLGLIALKIGISIDDKAMIITAILTLVFKFLLIPYILKILSIKFLIPRNILPNIKVHYLVMVVPIILVFTYYLITPVVNNFSHSNYVALAISALFLSLLLIMEHKNIAAKIIGFLSIENTLFLLGISSTNGMPMLVELGIFVDLLMLIVIINLLFKYQGE